MRNERGWLARAGAALADAGERWFPDAFVFALAAIVVVFAAAWPSASRPRNWRRSSAAASRCWYLPPLLP